MLNNFGGTADHINVFCLHSSNNMEIYSFTGTGLQIPPAAQQALQMSGSLAFGAVAGRN